MTSKLNHFLNNSIDNTKKVYVTNIDPNDQNDQNVSLKK